MCFYRRKASSSILNILEGNKWKIIVGLALGLSLVSLTMTIYNMSSDRATLQSPGEKTTLPSQKTTLPSETTTLPSKTTKRPSQTTTPPSQTTPSSGQTTSSSQTTSLDEETTTVALPNPYAFISFLAYGDTAGDSEFIPGDGDMTLSIDFSYKCFGETVDPPSTIQLVRHFINV